jgi:uncharacterized protein
MKPRLINCPQCGTATPYSSENRFRPFCSERCKMIDLGHWADEDYRIPEAQPLDPNEAEKPGN